MTDPGAVFRRQSFVHIAGALPEAVFAGLARECGVLIERATRLLSESASAPVDWSEYNRTHEGSPIIVPEVGDRRQLCRLENLAGCSAAVRDVARGDLARVVEAAVGYPVVLFKDKCNLKHPGGGAFGPHQDIVAYRHFAASYHVTAAVLLESATRDNGCLEVAVDYRSSAAAYENKATPLGPLPIFPSSAAADTHGDIDPAIAAGFRWTALEATAGDVVVFDSYLPHRSAINRSPRSRKILFFTYNLQSDGDHYEAYYRAKRADGDNPIFHVSTPTPFRGRS